MEDTGHLGATLQVAQYYMWGFNTVQIDMKQAVDLLRHCDQQHDFPAPSPPPPPAVAEARSLIAEYLYTERDFYTLKTGFFLLLLLFLFFLNVCFG